jgi:hypothetical protein
MQKWFNPEANLTPYIMNRPFENFFLLYSNATGKICPVIPGLTGRTALNNLLFSAHGHLGGNRLLSQSGNP